MKLLLASKSPRRRELIVQLGFPVETVNIEVTENIPNGLPAHETAEYLSRLKADAYPADKLHEDEVLVTADTIVALHGKVLGKPHSREEAIAMLEHLSGNSHVVYSGVCLTTKHQKVSFTESTTVHFLPLDRSTIEHYVSQYKPFDKAGAYGIQEWIGMVGVKGIEGCFYNVMGLPLARLYSELLTLGQA